MLLNTLLRYLAVALPFVGSAILLFSCEDKNAAKQQPTNLEKLMTEYSENLSIVTSDNGHKSYHFTTPLMEGYSLAREPYKEFRKGIKIVTYEKDTTDVVSATLTANYAIFYETRELWEAKGDVVIIQNNGRRLYTSQLFWNQSLHRIYSNVDSRVVDGDEIYDCEGFESDEQMKDWHYRKIKGVTYFTEPEPRDEADSVGGAKVEPVAEQKSGVAAEQKSAPKSGTTSKSTSKTASKSSSNSSATKSSTTKSSSAKPAADKSGVAKDGSDEVSRPKSRRSRQNGRQLSDKEGLQKESVKPIR